MSGGTVAVDRWGPASGYPDARDSGQRLSNLASALRAAPILSVIRAVDGRTVEDTAAALSAGGVRVVEISLTTPDALTYFEATRRRLGGSAVLGVGTVLTVADAQAALNVGADFLVSPFLNEDVLAFARAADLPVCCGVLTPTEVYRATALGAPFVKLFPAGSLGADYLRELRAPFPTTRFIPTGGVGAHNLAAFRDAGAIAVGMGGALAPAASIAGRDWQDITDRAHQALHSWREDKPT